MGVAWVVVFPATSDQHQAGGPGAYVALTMSPLARAASCWLSRLTATVMEITTPIEQACTQEVLAFVHGLQELARSSFHNL
jgi:hypothetical protein